MRQLSDVTLVGADCVDVERLVRAAEISTASLAFTEVRLLSSIPCAHPWVTRIEHLASIESYNDFAIKDLHRYVETRSALVIQHDGFVLNPKAWTDEFLDWDYVGAPWAHEGKLLVGNGGFSLRSRRLMQRLAASDIQRPAGVPEDWFICVVLRDQLVAEGFRFAPVALARRFSLEGDPALGVTWTDQLGFHGLAWTDISSWLSQHPGSGVVNDLDEVTRRLVARERQS